MSVTNHDLSYNKVELDYTALLRTANIAVGRCTDRISEHLADVRQLHRKCNLELTTEWLYDEAYKLAVAGATLYALENGLEREEVVIVNKPEKKEE